MSPTTKHLHAIKRAIVEFSLLTIGFLWVPGAVYLDAVIIDHGIPEHGFTEASQELFLFISAASFFYLARKHPLQRGFFILVAGFFLTMLIREFDHDLDKIVHGFWKYPAWLIAIVSITLARHYPGTVVAPMAAATRNTSFQSIFIGLILLLFFSRVFGTGGLWEPILYAAEYNISESLIKSVVQEGLELLGYTAILFGTIKYLLEIRKPNG